MPRKYFKEIFKELENRNLNELPNDKMYDNEFDKWVISYEQIALFDNSDAITSISFEYLLLSPTNREIFPSLPSFEINSFINRVSRFDFEENDIDKELAA